MNQRPPGYEPDELPTALLRDDIKFGAENRGRTGTILLPGDFKSPASANSAIPAGSRTLSVLGRGTRLRPNDGSGGRTRTDSLSVNSRVLRH